MIPDGVERRARWVLDSIGATELGLGDDVGYDERGWEQVEQGVRPDDPLALAFFELARLEERGAERDAHGRFPSSVMPPPRRPRAKSRTLSIKPDMRVTVVLIMSRTRSSLSSCRRPER